MPAWIEGNGGRDGSASFGLAWRRSGIHHAERNLPRVGMTKGTPRKPSRSMFDERRRQHLQGCRDLAARTAEPPGARQGFRQIGTGACAAPSPLPWGTKGVLGGLIAPSAPVKYCSVSLISRDGAGSGRFRTVQRQRFAEISKPATSGKCVAVTSNVVSSSSWRHTRSVKTSQVPSGPLKRLDSCARLAAHWAACDEQRAARLAAIPLAKPDRTTALMSDTCLIRSDHPLAVTIEHQKPVAIRFERRPDNQSDPVSPAASSR